MHGPTIHCDQAIHTSLRTAMGEGYRIVAASQGLRPREKQTILRTSPTLDSICLPPESTKSEPLAVSFYQLSSKRLCLALSRFAGQEHTGRGGKRVYTINVILNDEDFARCGYNPFRIVRSLFDTGMAEPKLNPDPVLPQLELPIPDDDAVLEEAMLPTLLPEHLRPFILDTVLDGKALVVDIKDEWTECAEGMILAVPGPMRMGLSFSAGLNFSTSRKHALQFLSDPRGKAKTRCPAIGAIFIPSGETPPVSKEISGWSTMAARYWREGRLADLSRRTSRPYDDTSKDARERLAALFETQDDIPRIEVARLVILAGEIIHHPATGAEKEVCEEFVSAVGASITARLSTLSPPEGETLFDELASLWRKSPEATRFAQPILEAFLQRIVPKNPLIAMEMALKIAVDLPETTDRSQHESLLKNVATQFASWAKGTNSDELAQVPQLVRRWISIRPDSPELDGVDEHCTTAIEKTIAAN